MKLNSRFARPDDLMLYFRWVNDPEVRKNSFDTRPVSLVDHTTWYLHNIHSDQVVMLIFMDGNTAMGQVRFHLDGTEARLNYSLDASYRGRGFAASVISMSLAELAKVNTVVMQVRAEVKPDNQASIRVFEKCRFEREDVRTEKISFLCQLSTWRSSLDNES